MTGLGRREVVLVVDRRQLAGRFDAALPDALAVGAVERLDDEDGLAGSGARAVAAPSARSPCAAASAPCTRRGWLPSRLTPAPICDVT